MAQFGAKDQYSDAPKFVVDAATGQTGQELFGNSVFAVDAAEAAATPGVAHAGWVYRTLGTGPVTAFVINDAGTGYANDDTVDVEGGTANAVGTFTTDASGNIVSVAITTQGAGFANVESLSYTINTSGGSGANVEVATLGGRSGRVNIETLAASKSIVTDATDFANTSTDAVANTTGTADDAIFPDS